MLRQISLAKWWMPLSCVFTYVLVLLWDAVLVASSPIIIPRKELFYRSFTNGSLGNYRYLTVDENVQALYVGARNYVFRLNLEDISTRSQRSEEILPASPCSVQVSNPRLQNPRLQNPRLQNPLLQNPLYCESHIRLIIRQNNLLFACGTGALVTRAITLHESNLTFSDVKNYVTTICPADPDQNYTMVWVEKGNPNDIPTYYYGFPHLSRDNTHPDISRINDTLVTNAQSILGLHAPVDFVGSFELDKYVYFWYREKSVEYSDGHNRIYARVARVCKNDSQTPKSYLFYYVWFTYVKARLNCTIPGYQPNAFDHLQDVFLIKNTFYAIFATASGLNGGLDASAICEFDVDAINSVLDNATYQKLNTKQMTLEPLPEVSPDAADIRRIKQCHRTSNDTTNNALLTKTQDYLLTDEAVRAKGDKAVFYTTSAVYRKMAIQKVGKRTVYFLATNRGEIQKLVTWTENNSEGKEEIHSHLVAEWRPFTKPTLIWSFKLFDGNLYIGTDDQVVQINVSQCTSPSYQSCHICVRDPHCGWDTSTKTCISYAPGLLQNLQDPFVCALTIEEQHITIPGNAAHLRCTGRQATNTDVHWLRNDTLISSDSQFIFTKDDGLIILSVTLKMRNDRFICRAKEEGRVLNIIQYTVVMTECNGNSINDYLRCEFISSFKQWQSHFELASKVQKKWQCIANKYRNCAYPVTTDLPCPSGSSQADISNEILNKIPNAR